MEVLLARNVLVCTLQWGAEKSEGSDWHRCNKSVINARWNLGTGSKLKTWTKTKHLTQNLKACLCLCPYPKVLLFLPVLLLSSPRLGAQPICLPPSVDPRALKPASRTAFSSVKHFFIPFLEICYHLLHVCFDEVQTEQRESRGTHVSAKTKIDKRLERF